MLNSYFVVGTDTDCGKTYVTAALLDYFRTQKQTARALKPLVSGCIEQAGVLISEDVERLQIANQTLTPPISRWMMKPPISPHLAAEASGITLSIDDIIAFCNAYPRAEIQHLLIEGAGGLMVPLNNKETWVDFLIQSGIPVILVVGMRLGCINYALLTAEVLKTKGIRCKGWIANFLDPKMLVPEENLQTLIDKLHCPLLGTVGFNSGFTIYGEYII
ncbi:MAG: dethiobiotin synthase [Gammaproteobacteria bacterium]|nr:dethiobiotin synthase [Gammaproteobacteria bacterium]